MQKMNSGCFFVIEGADGTGKTSIIDEIKYKLRRNKQKVRIETLFEPHNSKKILKKIDSKDWLKMFYFFVKDREDTVTRIEKILSNNDIVILDRYYHSTCVYQSVSSGLSEEFLLANHPDWLIKPDLTLILNIPLHESIKRIRKRTNETKNDTLIPPMDVFKDNMQLRFLVKKKYLKLLSKKEFNECVVINSVGSVEDNTKLCLKQMKDILDKRYGPSFFQDCNY